MDPKAAVNQLSLGAKRLLLALHNQGGQKEFIIAGGPQQYETIRQLLTTELVVCNGKVVTLACNLSDEIKEQLKEVCM